ncbi:Predicted nuclease, contains PIN domain, potential toxin-antitoxin system component [Ruaniaceae bacterium KH17]|nr:Predicted nuclease, contains PIN domain, potential toxin-antitoxin system component [Ruaniaceae bacterium KH17]
MTQFIVDQQLPRALALHLTERGHGATHVKDYPGGTTLRDDAIARIADDEQRFVITKDDDFRIAHLLHQTPARLLHITCGNISTRDLIALIDQHYDALSAALAAYNYIELDRAGVIVYDPT